MIYIRTDANRRAATGHVMRCITVARQLRSLGGQVLFLFRDGFLAAMLKQVCQAGLQARYRFIVVAGKLTSNIDILQDYARRYPQIELLENVKDMAGILQRADLAVSAASTVLYECCCVGVSTIFLTVAENQKYTGVFSESGMMLYAGDFQRDGRGVLEQILRLIEKASLDVDCRKKMTERMKGVVDGKGARLIAEAILAL